MFILMTSSSHFGESFKLKVVIFKQMLHFRRYSEFVALQAQLARLFPDLITPALPGKWFFKLSAVQLQKRRAGLESWLQEVEYKKLEYYAISSNIKTF